ncbi:phosphodiester glycosidase family protein [Sphingobacterium faecale]|uniref:Phosphodiester glycosidase family protein n=1 Tax=Sphingobacterium faecale TaxID=2803775 RepID=A0ABS1RAY4_9SPHI|nr:phosphodiester glycosidase family protein [Sphingobacterium faecale]MBL1411187.1 phosphodiester glycosidase family protein [Sphingobacterium faecale]
MVRFSLKYSLWFITLVMLSACDSKEDTGLYSIYQLDKYKNGKGVVSLNETWEKQESLMKSFPKGIEVYRTHREINGKVSNICLVAFNPKHNIDFKPIVSKVAQTPTDFFKAESGDVYVCLNAGFFSGNTSLSLAIYNTAIQSINTKSLQRPFNNVNTPYYPTRAAFGLNSDFAPSVSWVYSVGAGNGVLYQYPQPSPNELGLAPQNIPSAIFPQGGAVWNPRSAIGGSPMLIHKGQIKITDNEELADLDNNAKRARSAIGHLSNGNIVLLAAEGAQTGNVNPSFHGLTLRELADVMLEVGCVGAINLDGGGSSSMVIGGEQVITPSDKNGERKVVSAIILKGR